MNVSIATQNEKDDRIEKWQDENCTGMYSKRVMSQNGEHLVSLCESNNLETQVTFPYSELPRCL